MALKIRSWPDGIVWVSGNEQKPVSWETPYRILVFGPECQEGCRAWDIVPPGRCIGDGLEMDVQIVTGTLAEVLTEIRRIVEDNYRRFERGESPSDDLALAGSLAWVIGNIKVTGTYWTPNLSGPPETIEFDGRVYHHG